MKTGKLNLLLTALLPIAAGMVFAGLNSSSSTVAPQTPVKNDDVKFEPVDDMHHFMEYVCQPSHRALQELMQNQSDDRRVWRQIRSHAMILAETSALVSGRAGKDNDRTELWQEISHAVYTHGKEMYQQAGKKDFAATKKSYGLMIDQCNRCHNEFENGKHQLKK